MLTVTVDQLVAIMPECSHIASKYISPLNEALERFEINTPLRASAFIAQIGHESTRLTRVEENLNYSANGLLRTWPDYFTADTAKELAYKPMAIANKVYSGKGGNGDEASGDGWRFRGRGFLQVTLKRNYQRRGTRLVQDENYFVVNPDLLLEPEWAIRSACDYWDENDLSTFADVNSEMSFRDLTRRINRALRGLDDRLSLWRIGKHVFAEPSQEIFMSKG